MSNTFKTSRTNTYAHNGNKYVYRQGSMPCVHVRRVALLKRYEHLTTAMVMMIKDTWTHTNGRFVLARLVHAINI